jgi:hypothetical protein
MDPELHPPMLSVSWAPGHGATGTLRTNCASLYPMLDSLPLSRYHFRVTAGRARAALALALDDKQHRSKLADTQRLRPKACVPHDTQPSAIVFPAER